MAGDMRLAADHDLVAVVVVDEQSKDAGQEEEDAVPGGVSGLQDMSRLRFTYMMPKAKLALSMAHCLSMSTP